MKLKFRKLYANSPESLEKASIMVRKMGTSQILSIRLLMMELDLSLRKANEIIAASKAWNKKIEDSSDLYFGS